MHSNLKQEDIFRTNYENLLENFLLSTFRYISNRVKK